MLRIKPLANIFYYLKIFLFLFNLVTSHCTRSKDNSEFKKYPGTISELLRVKAYCFLNLSEIYFHISLLLLLLPSINIFILSSNIDKL